MSNGENLEMGKEVKISIEQDHLYIDRKPMEGIYQPADNTYIITTFSGRYKLVKRVEANQRSEELEKGVEMDKIRLMNAIFGKMPEILPSDEVIEQVLSILSERERFVLEHWFGDPPMSLRAIAKIYPRIDGVTGATPQRIQQIEARALRRLRHPSRSRILKGLS